jgi:hypothetical protein
MRVHKTPAQIHRFSVFSPGKDFQIRPFAGLKFPGTKAPGPGLEDLVHLVIVNPRMTPEDTPFLAGFQDDPLQYIPPYAGVTRVQ